MQQEKILLFGGTAETYSLCEQLLKLGYHVTLSTISDDSHLLPENQPITRKIGRMDQSEITSYLCATNFKAVICAVHPYAKQARENIIAACRDSFTLLYIYLRNNSSLKEYAQRVEILPAPDHQQAAAIANSLPGNILLTTGSNNLKPYMQQITDSKNRLYARALNCPSSEQALHAAGIIPEHMILARGPFSTADNLELIRRFSIRVLITKDGGSEGGTPAKLEAAAQTSCKVILIGRPAPPKDYYTDIASLIKKIKNS